MDKFVHGCNLAWLNFGQDFGDGPLAKGISVPQNSAAVDLWLAKAQDAGMSVVRWFMFCEPTNLALDASNHYFTVNSGSPTGIKPNVLTDLDAAVTLAEKRGLSLALVLFNHVPDMPRTWIEQPTPRTALITALGPMFARYKGRAGIFSWEIGNEWTGQMDGYNTYINETALKALIRAFVIAVHTNGGALAGCSAGTLQDLRKLTGLGLDYYSASWYANSPYGQGVGDPTQHDYAYYNQQQGLAGKPLIVGEALLGPSDGAIGRYQYLLDHGYAGAWGWSATPSAGDGFRIDWDAARALGEILRLRAALTTAQARYAATYDHLRALQALPPP